MMPTFGVRVNIRSAFQVAMLDHVTKPTDGWRSNASSYDTPCCGASTD